MNTDNKNIDYYMELSYTTVVEADKCGDEECFTAYNPELEGCLGFGPTWRDAIASLKQARKEYIETALELGWSVPVPPQLSLPQPIHVQEFQSVRLPRPKSQSAFEYGYREVYSEKVPA